MIAGYDIADFLAWDAETWDRLLTNYQTTIWPAQVVALAVFVSALWLFVKSATRYSHAPLMAVLATCWVWVGLLFHKQFHAQLNWAAHYWVYACLIQAALLFALALARREHRLHPDAWRAWLVCLVLSCLLVVLIGALWGRSLQALSWPLLNPDALAWITMLALLVCAASVGRQWMVWFAIVVPVLVLTIDGLIAFSLPTYDRLMIVVSAFAVTAVAHFSVGRVAHPCRNN